jgi:DnaK suppressor protein
MNALDVDRFERALKATEADIARLLSRREGIAIERASDTVDDVQFKLEREVTALSLQRETGRLSAVRLALDRIADHTYGICERCEHEIATKRLAAVPWARCCVRCQQRVDEEQHQERDYYRALAS